MKSIKEDILQWFRDRPVVIQESARRILDKGDLDAADYDDLKRVCCIEVGMTFDDGYAPAAKQIPDSAISQDSHSHRIEITSISNVTGVNALGPRNPLKLQEGLTVIYGHNGSGKSGYTRLLKQICGAKSPGTLHGNAFDKTPINQACRVEYKFDGNDGVLEWDSSRGVSEQLSAVELYDSNCGSIYVTDENQLAYKPPLLNLMSSLILACDHLSSMLDQEISLLVSAKPQLPIEYINTKYGKWYSSISAKIESSEIESACVWSESNQENLESLTARLKLPDPLAEAEKVRKSKKQIDKLVAGFENWKNKLGAESISAYFEKKKDFELRQKTATEYAKSIFQKSPLDGIGEEAWKLMWEKAREYSESHAYPQQSYPNVSESASCVLCQQPLGEDAKIRLSEFEGFVKGELEAEAKAARNKLGVAEEIFKKVPEEELISSFVTASGMEQSLSEDVLSLRVVIEKKATEVLSTESEDELSIEIDFGVIDKLKSLSTKMDRQASNLDKDAEKDNRENIKIELLELESKKWVFQQKSPLLSELELLGKKSILQKAKSNVGTTAITRKKSVLAEELVSTEYINRFQSELGALGAGRIKANLEKTRSSKGRVYFQIKLEGNKRKLPLDQILSEGEFRIISLAAFLADVEGHEDKSTFIFDDPISSLDQDYEENVAERLVELSKHRQVLVFTHRLSLMALLEETNKKQGMKQNTIGLYKESWGAGEPGHPPIYAQKTKAAINTLIEKIPEGRNVLEEQGQEAYSWWAKGVCSNTRITVEKVVEFDLLADVVQRFRRPINTQGKLINVAKVTEEDCHYIDRLMTKYSKYEHSQPNESPVPPPYTDELEADLSELKAWREKFTS